MISSIILFFIGLRCCGMNDHVSRQGDVPSLFCRVCKGSSLEPLDTCYGFDRSSETWILSGCRQCGVVSTTPFLSVSELATYYHADYYGGEENDQKSEAKFHPWLEWLVKLANGRRGLTGLRYLERSAIRHGLEPDRPLRWNLLDVGCGRGAFLKSLAQLGHRCTGTDITPFSSLATSGLPFCKASCKTSSSPPNPSMGFGSGTCSSTRPTPPKPSKRFRDCCATMGLSPSPFPISIVGNEGSSVGIGSISICRDTNFISAALPCSDCSRRMAFSRFEWRP